MKLHFPRIPRDGESWFDHEIHERVAIMRELLDKHAEELQAASRWKRWLIAFRIGREAKRIQLHRL